MGLTLKMQFSGSDLLRYALARTMHKFSTAATKSSVLPALRLVGLLNVLKSTFAGASVATERLR